MRWGTSNCSSILIYRLWEDERLSWPGWQTVYPHKWSSISWRSGRTVLFVTFNLLSFSYWQVKRQIISIVFSWLYLTFDNAVQSLTIYWYVCNVSDYLVFCIISWLMKLHLIWHGCTQLFIDTFCQPSAMYVRLVLASLWCLHWNCCYSYKPTAAETAVLYNKSVAWFYLMW